MTQQRTYSGMRVAPLSIDYPVSHHTTQESTYTIDKLASIGPRRVAARFSPCLRKYRWDPYAVLLTDYDLERVKKSYRRATGPTVVLQQKPYGQHNSAAENADCHNHTNNHQHNHRHRQQQPPSGPLRYQHHQWPRAAAPQGYGVRSLRL
ncbi:hypothetical protein, unlikely [Trypanosoma congolense IL3000]|uniref:Uncharacterized protein n=1 Tax=Trypanosoma congolense (strain IL3000) TaxID=1068625 RepID=F9W828_TRYCI|nr:hypothetical protein, unlikely [Trypanosoma congolense IL3000]